MAFTAGFNLGLGFMENDGDEDDDDSILMGSNGGALHLIIGRMRWQGLDTVLPMGL